MDSGTVSQQEAKELIVPRQFIVDKLNEFKGVIVCVHAAGVRPFIGEITDVNPLFVRMEQLGDGTPVIISIDAVVAVERPNSEG